MRTASPTAFTITVLDAVPMKYHESTKSDHEDDYILSAATLATTEYEIRSDALHGNDRLAGRHRFRLAQQSPDD